MFRRCVGSVMAFFRTCCVPCLGYGHLLQQRQQQLEQLTQQQQQQLDQLVQQQQQLVQLQLELESQRMRINQQLDQLVQQQQELMQLQREVERQQMRINRQQDFQQQLGIVQGEQRQVIQHTISLIRFFHTAPD